MKKLQIKLFGLLAVILTLGFMVLTNGCEGPQGPAGISGISGNGTCNDCHNTSSDLKARIIQYQNSVHATAGNFTRNTTACAPCHTSDGFIERIASGAQTTKATIENPTPPDCRACHFIHTTFTDKDFALRGTDPVTLWTNSTKTINIGKGNLCVNCHQPRPATPVATVGDTASLKITSSRWGPHYGPQSSILIGTGGYEIKGSQKYTNSLHFTAVKDGCIGCHMQPPYGNQAGGHTWKMSYGAEGSTIMTPLVTACANCHEGAKDFNVYGGQKSVDSLMAILKTRLVTKGIYDTTNSLAKLGTYPNIVAGAYWNYKTVLGEKSRGVHNLKYVKALLTNSIESIP